MVFFLEGYVTIFYETTKIERMIYTMRKKLVMLLLVVALISSIMSLSAAAYSGSYSFNIRSNIFGSTVHTLANEDTWSYVTGETYDAAMEISAAKAGFTVELYKSWLTNYKFTSIADGYYAFKDWGIVSANSYTVNVVKTGGEGDRIIGNGSIVN